MRALKDDKSYQVNYFCSTVVRKDALEKYPKLKETLELMDGILTDQKMAELNYQNDLNPVKTGLQRPDNLTGE